MWVNFLKSTNTVSVTILCKLIGTPTDASQPTGMVVIHTQDSNGFLVIRTPVNTTSTLYPTTVCLCTDLTDTTTYTRVGNSTIPHSTTSAGYITIDIVGGGTSDGHITICSDTDSNNSRIPSGTAVIDTSVDLTNYTNFSAVSLHAPSHDSSSSVFLVGGVVASTLSLRASQMLFFIPTAYNGTYKDWIGSLGSMTTSPTVYTNYGAGFYGTNVGDKVTFGNRTDVTLPTGYEIRGMTLGANVSGGSESSVSVAPYLYNATTKVDYTGTSESCSPDGGAYTWLWDKDPITGAKWQLTDYNGYEFGMKRAE